MKRNNFKKVGKQPAENTVLTTEIILLLRLICVDKFF